MNGPVRRAEDSHGSDTGSNPVTIKIFSLKKMIIMYFMIPLMM